MRSLARSIWIVLAGGTLVTSCIDPFDAETGEFVSAIVIDATITDENEQQTVYLSRTYKFEEEGPEAVSGAEVTVVENGTNTISFTEVENGEYRSQQPFAAQAGSSYVLNVRTPEGNLYESQSASLPDAVALESVYADRITSDLGQDGIAIFVDSFDASGNSPNFRYEFQETYKIIAPQWNAFDLLSTGIECGVDIIPKTVQNQTCFASNVSNDIILANTANLDENRVQRFMVRFMDRSNYIISHRYSIEVTQYTQSDEAAAYFSALDQFSSTESIFSESQPGFLVGNVFSREDTDEKVLGYFDVSAVDRQRIFFNYSDFFEGEDLPPFVNPCRTIAPMLISQGGARCILSALVDAGQVSYFDVNADPPFEEGPYLVVPRECGDCTVLGSNQTPDFWSE
ncbi:MAG: DUF4249 domain-containing protein [Bacteroidota bacterium]